MVQKQKTTKIGLFLIGLILFLIGLIMAQFWETLVLTRFYTETSLVPGTRGYKEWQKTKVPIKTSFYFWNWTNPEQIHNENVKPHFVEMGPYVFWQSREKVNLTYNSENATVTYRNKLYYYFDPELSNGSLSDNVTSINMIAASAAYMTRTWSKFFLYGLSMFLRSSGQQVHWTKNVSQLLFQGFENPVQKISTYIPGYDGPDKFGWMYGFNNTVQPGILNVDSGKNDINKIGQIYFWDYKNESDLYPDCREIKGSNAEFFAPFVTPETRLEMYLPEMCRRVFHYYIGESTYEGLKTYVFSATKKTYDDGNIVPENKCYCVDEDCVPSGIYDISKCAQGAPIGLSLPHFLYADPYYTNGIEGMNPDEMKHMYYSELEPITAVQINVSAKVQINVRLARNTGLSLFRDVPNVYIPVMWQENQVHLKGDYLSGIQLLVFVLTYGPHIWYGTCGAGFSIIVFVAIYHLYNQNSLKHIKRNLANKTQEAAKKAEEQKLKNGDENEKETVKYVISDDKAVIVD